MGSINIFMPLRTKLKLLEHLVSIEFCNELSLHFQQKEVKKVEVRSESEKPIKFEDEEELTKAPKELELDEDMDLKEEDSEHPKLSKRKLKKLSRLSVAELKQLVTRPGKKILPPTKGSVTSYSSSRWAVVVAQFVELSLPTPEIRGSNPIIIKFYLL